jgi:hypothetical protein
MLWLHANLLVLLLTTQLFRQPRSQWFLRSTVSYGSGSLQLHGLILTQYILLAQGSRTTVYKGCTHEIYAPFGECARWDGLVERLTTFADDERRVEEEVRQFPRLCTSTPPAVSAIWHA